jgi:phosphoribosylformylglycinamidine (FGAM) synthase-like enzyme
LQSAYRRALSASVVAHARYLAVQGDRSVTQRQIVQQKIAWQSMEARKAKIRARLMLERTRETAWF